MITIVFYFLLYYCGVPENIMRCHCQLSVNKNTQHITTTQELKLLPNDIFNFTAVIHTITRLTSEVFQHTV